MDPSSLVATVNTYLDSLDIPTSVGEAKERMEKIRNFISLMRDAGFHTPLKYILPLYRNYVPESREELLEVSPLLERLLYSLNERKWTYERAKVAYVANRFSYFILKQKALQEWLPFLPYGGGFLLFSEEGGIASLRTFNSIVSVLTDMGVPLSTSRVVGSAVCNRVNKEALEHIEEKVRAIENYDAAVEYLTIVSKYDIVRINENPVILDKLMEELGEKGFLENGQVKEEVLIALKRVYTTRRKLYMVEAEKLLGTLVIGYEAAFPKSVKEKGPLRGFKLSEQNKEVLVTPLPNGKEALELVKFVDRVPFKRGEIAKALTNLSKGALDEEDELIVSILKDLRSNMSK